MPKPLLSFGIIFKNEIRCLERCLKSLAPLREAVPCELVMADTGSDDGSREVAEKYADILIDFPWINDFAAARNSVIERCTGRWLFILDADEWLDEDVRELVNFVRSNNQKSLEGCIVCIRNYSEPDDRSLYSDFHTMRLIRLSTGVHFVGSIHEQLRNAQEEVFTNIKPLHRTILHHDGYIGLNQEDGKAKRLRNQALLEKRLEKDPENVRLLLQYIETSRPDPQHMEYVHRGLAAVEAKKAEWEVLGPVIYRYAVLAAQEKGLPEEEEWILQAEERFPQSFYTRIDIAYLAFGKYWGSKDYSKCIYWGEKYRNAVAEHDAGQGDPVAERVSTLLSLSGKWRQRLNMCLASAYRKEGQPGRAQELLEAADSLDGKLVGETLKNLQELQVSTSQDTAPSILRLYDRITGEKDEERAQELMTAFLQAAPLVFSPDVREREKAREDFHRYSYTLYLPLADRCEAGAAAAVLEAESVQEVDRLLRKVEKWGDFSVSALLCALEKGASFPPAGQTMRMEEMDHIAKRLAQYKGRFFQMVCRTAPGLCSGSWQQLNWARSITFAAVQGFDWTDEEQGLALAEAFVTVVGTFVSRCYTAEVLCEENIQVLPSLHRFGWYSGRAFRALESGDAAGYVRLLRAGLDACPKMKVMVEFLTKHTPQLKPSPAQELLALADKVRGMLAAFDPADPAVEAIRQSPVYQKVAGLIEGAEPPALGGLTQETCNARTGGQQA